MARLSIKLLGCLEITLDEATVTRFESDKVRALLVYLAAESGEPHRREKLAGLLWPDSPDRAARVNLRRVLAQLRQAIGDRQADPPFLHITRHALQFNGASDAWVDVRAFTEPPESKDRGGQSTGRLENAVALYRGDFLEGFSLRDSALFEEWTLLMRERLRRLAVETLDQLVDRYEAAGAYEDALPHAWRMLELDPWRERAHRQLMRLLTVTGQRSAALAQYEVCCQLLEGELGAQPAAQTTALYEQILAGELAVCIETTGPPPHNLPVQPTPFVGRETVLAEIKERLADPTCRLLTLVGPGGCGKTRLALEVAGRQLDANAYPGGVFFVSLAPLNAVESIVPTVADALGFTFYEGATPWQQLLDYLRAKTILLVMDNYEHLLTLPHEGTKGAARLVTDIIRTAPGVKVMATSRVRLNVGGEHRFQVRGMECPGPETPLQELHQASSYSAVRLFTQGARRAKQGFELSEENLDGVVEICRLVDGMPLAIRLAAPWVAVLPPQEIAAQLGHNLDILATDRQDVPGRQRSVRASLEHTWRLISERERELMQALSIFRGGFTRDAAQQVAGASLHELMALVDRSLVYRSPAERYEIHELLRQYTEEKMTASPAAADAARDRHCAHFAAALDHWGSELKGSRQMTALAAMRADAENVRATWEWAVAQRQVLRMGQALEGLCRFFHWRGRFREGQATCRAAADALGPKPQGDRLRLLIRTLEWASVFCTELEQSHTASEMLNRCLSLLETLDGDTRCVKAGVLAQMAGLAINSGDNVQARRLYQDSLDLWQALGDRWGEARALAGIGWVAWSRGAYDEAQGWAEKSLAIRRSRGDKRGIAESLSLMGVIAAYHDQMDESVNLRRELVAIYNQIGDRPSAALGLHGLATGLVWSGEFPEAQALLQQSRVIYDDLGSRAGVAQNDLFLGWIDGMLGNYAQARARIENSLLTFRELGSPSSIGRALRYLGIMEFANKNYAAAEALLNEAVELYEEIGRMHYWSIAVASLGFVARALGDTARAWRHLNKALQADVELHAHGTQFFPIPLLALLLADAGDSEAERAVEFYALASRYPFVSKSRFYEDIAGRHIAAVAATLPPEVVAAAQERGRARDLWETAEEMLKESEGQLGTAEGR